MSNVVYPLDTGAKPGAKLKWLPRRIKVAVIGGGLGSFIADHHIGAMRRINLYEIVSGAPSRDAEKCELWRRANFLLPHRVYPDWKEMLQCERKLGARPDVICIFTETEYHAEMAIASLEAGFHVITDKPPTVTLQEMLKVEQAALKAGKLYLVTYNHNCYGAVIHGAELIAKKTIGDVITAETSFRQAWGLSNPKFKQAWRFKGRRCCGSDIGAHAERLLSKWMSACAFSLRLVSGRCRILAPAIFMRLGDDCVDAELTYANKKHCITARLCASEMMAGHEDALDIAVYGTKGSIRWSHLKPGELTLTTLKGGEKRYLEGRDFSTPASFNPGEHPTGFADCWAATYLGSAGKIAVASEWLTVDELPPALRIEVCGLPEAMDSMRFLEALYQSSDTAGWGVSLSELKVDA